MKIYNLKTLHYSRIVAGVFLIPLILILSIIVAAEWKSFILAILFAIALVFLLYYYCKANITVTVINNYYVRFKYDKKLFFNIKNPSEITITDIRYLVIDNNEILRKIVTENRIININNLKFKQDNTRSLIDDLRKDFDVKTLNSWDHFNKKKFAKVAYHLNFGLIVCSIIVAVIYIYYKGFQPFIFSILLLIIPQMFLYGKQMRRK